MKTLFTGIIVFLLILTAVLLGRKKRIEEADSAKNEIKKVKEDWSMESMMSVSQVQEMRDELLTDIRKKLASDPDHLAELEKIIQDWADLKLKTFRERRSWIRKTE